jgi:hypothetical protein
MRYKKIITVVAVSAASLFSYELLAQDTPIGSSEYKRMDSVQTVYERDQVQTQKSEDLQRLKDAKSERSETKAKAKEADRIEDEANDAAKQSKNALKAEKKAQKLRKEADEQSKKAEEARDKSDRN